MVSVPRDTPTTPGPAPHAPAPSAPSTPMDTSLGEANKEETPEAEQDKPEEEVRGDPEVAPKYVRHLLPVFTEVFHVTMLPSVRKASLSLVRKMLHYMSSSLLGEMVDPEFPAPNFAASL